MIMTTTTTTTTTKKKRLGKCARRRAQKARAITSSTTQAAILEDIPQPSHCHHENERLTLQAERRRGTMIPTDRGYVLEGVKIRRREYLQRLQQIRTCSKSNQEEDTTIPFQEDMLSILTIQQKPNLSNDYDDDDKDDDWNDKEEGNERNVSLPPEDERALLSQLGYIPGNAICVVARITKKKPVDNECDDNDNTEDDVFLSSIIPPSNHHHIAQSSHHHHHLTCPSMATTTTTTTITSCTQQPSVVQLYPIVARQKYKGGKSDGRSYKGRRRGAMRLEMNEQNNDQQLPTLLSPEEEEEVGTTTITTTTTTTTTTTMTPNMIVIEPFPTLYWLTHPQLHSQISKLELSRTHNVTKMEEKLRSSPLYLQQMQRAHVSYGKKRLELLTEQDVQYVKQRGWIHALDERRGVAGIRLCKMGKSDDDNDDDDNEKDDDSSSHCNSSEKQRRRKNIRKSKGYDCVKCLHAHVAHYLAQLSEWEEQQQKEDDESWREEAKMKNRDGNNGSTSTHELEEEEKEFLTTKKKLTNYTRKECDWDDLNLIGKWAMDAVHSGILLEGEENEQPPNERSIV